MHVPVEKKKYVSRDDDDDRRKHTKWFTISIHADDHGLGEVYTKEKPLTSFWDDKLHVINGFVVLGSHVYAFGGLAIPMCLSDVCKFDVTRHGTYGFNLFLR